MTRTAVTILAFFLTAHVCTAQSPKQVTPTYRNPVIAGDFADPSVIRVGNTYYAAGTSSEWGPAFPIYTSTDLINWSYLGPVFDTLPAWTIGSYWAPELFYRNGTFYVYYTARRKSDKRSYIGVATTKNIRKPFTDYGLLIEWTTEAIDAFVLEDGGKFYITWKAYGLDKGKNIELLGAELEPDGLKLKGKAFTLLQADPAGWERGGAEGQAIIKRGRYYYMLYSGNACCGGGCNYQVGVARAERLQGPWKKFSGNPLLIGDAGWKCPGHGTVVTTPHGRYFYLHHAYNGTDFTATGRQGVLSELVWDNVTQWPRFRYGTTVPLQAESPTRTGQQKNLNLSVNFLKDTVAVPWVWDVSRPKPAYTIQNGYLQLAPDSAGFLGWVLKGGTFTFSADIRPQVQLQQSICLYGDAGNALGLGVRHGWLELWQLKDGVRTVLKTIAVGDTAQSVTVQLQSHAGRFYQFSWAAGSGKVQRLTKTPLDGAFLPRWDRAPRAGIYVSGQAKESSRVQAINMTYN
jgi:xylan 1,4-beta-xylosidase